MIYNEIKKKFLDSGFNIDTAPSEAEFILENVCNISFKDLFLGKVPSQELQKKAFDVVQKRIDTKMPLQYILNCAYFMNKKFFVNSSVLIPRPETQLLVDISKKFINKNSTILEIGTGSGIISIMLSLLTLNRNITAIDISESALDVAKINASMYSLQNDITFLQSDIYENINNKFDFIISNPPYIPIIEKQNLQIEVKDFEPDLALFASDIYGIEFYEKIIRDASLYLNNNIGSGILFELGINQDKLVYNLLEKYNYKKIELYKDLSGINRVICALI